MGGDSGTTCTATHATSFTALFLYYFELNLGQVSGFLFLFFDLDTKKSGFPFLFELGAFPSLYLVLGCSLVRIRVQLASEWRKEPPLFSVLPW